jgi:flagellar motor switch protein FliM
MGKILKLNRDLVARSMVSKSPQKAKKVRTELAKRVRHERSKGQARVMVSREVFGSFLKLHVGNVLWFELMRGGEGMSQLEVHDKQGAGAKVKPRVRTD